MRYSAAQCNALSDVIGLGGGGGDEGEEEERKKFSSLFFQFFQNIVDDEGYSFYPEGSL